jgi:MFS family permease
MPRPVFRAPLPSEEVSDSDPGPAPDSAPAARRRRFADLTPLTVPAFARLWIGSTVAGIGAQLTIVAVGLQIYDLSHSTLAVSLVGGLALAPMIVAGLWGGMLADAFDRRTVLIISSLVGWATTLGLIALSVVAAVSSTPPLWLFYVLTTLNSVAATISNATRSAVYPRILPTQLIAPANALNGIGFGLQLTVGPALAGVLVAAVGFDWTYAVDALLFTIGFFGIFTLPKLAPLHDAVPPGWRSLVEGIAFLRRAPNIRSGFLIDLVAMTFGRPYALFPAVGALAIGGGSVTVGVLTAAAAIGTFLTGLLSGPVGHVRRQGVAIGRAVMVYGACILLFGVVVGAMQTGWFGEIGPSFADVNLVALLLASLALLGSGAADEVSAIFRSTMLVVASPDGMRGRLQGIFVVVVTGGPRLGDLYAGVLASLVALWFPPVLGGLLIVVLVATIVRVVRSLRAYDALNPTP